MSRLMILAVVLTLSGCVDSRTGNPGGDFDSSVLNDERMVELLAPEEARLLCEEGSAFMNARFTTEEWEEQQCYGLAISIDRDPAACSDRFAMCIETGERTGYDWYFGYGFCGQITGPVAGCTVTVRDIEACYSRWGAATRQRYEERRCEVSGTPEAMEEFMYDPGCQALFSSPCRIVLGGRPW